MSLSSLSSFSLDLQRVTIDTPNSEPGSSREEKCGFSSRRGRNRNNQTPRDAQISNDFVHVAVRIKPYPSDADSSSILPFSIEFGTLGTPRTGRQRMSSSRGSAVHPATNVVVEAQNPCGSDQEGSCNVSNNDCYLASDVPVTSVVVPPVQNGVTQLALSPRPGVNAGGKILTVSFPTSDGVKRAKHMYEFGEVIGPAVTDAEICNSMVPCIIEQLKAGFNACVLCYGQTGSGKTHTVNALAPVFISELFANLDAENDIVEVSYIQIYNNSAYNLLGEGKYEHGVLLQKPRTRLVHEPRYLMRSAAEVRSRIAEAQRKRFVCSHALNTRSSRSHVILSLHVTKCVGGIPVSTSRLTLGDLAGSERVKRTGVAGEEREEAIAINKSLSVLHAVIKATVDYASVLPVRESILTLYLASSLTDSYLLLIATVSMEKQNYAETKSSLDFATTAKRCVLTKRKGRLRDYILSRANSFDETCTHLVKEIETLRHRVTTLQEEVRIEKQRSSHLLKDGGVDGKAEKEGKKPDPAACALTNCELHDSNTEDANVRDHVLALERQCVIFQNFLRDREQELNALESHGDLAEELRQQLYQRAREQEEARQVLEEAAPQLETSELLHKVTDTVLWMQEQLDSVYQQKEFMARAMEGMRGEQHRTMVELLESRKQLVQSAKNSEEMEQKVEKLNKENKELKDRVDELNLKLLREYAERAIREETVAWFKASGNRDEECERLNTAFEDQRNLCDVLQSRLTSTEQELDRSNKQHGTLLQEMRKKDEAFRTIWLLLTPQQKARFMSSGYGGDGGSGFGSASLHQGHENVQLRGQVRTLKRQLEEELQHSKELDYRIEDLASENSILQERLKNREEEYKNLVALDEDYRDEREQMEQQIAHLYTYIEEHNARKHVFEQQLREAQSEWERLDEEYRNAQREVVELTTKLEKAVEEIRTQEADKYKLKNQLREVRKHDALLASLHRQLSERRRSSDDSYRRLGLADRARQYVASEVNMYNQHTDLVKKKVTQRNPEVLRKMPIHRLDPAQYVRGTTTVQPTSLNNRVQRLRREVLQQLRLCGSSPVSTDGAAGAPRESSGSSYNHHSSTRHRKTFSHSNSRDTGLRAMGLRANTALTEAPTYITDKTRRRNS